VTVHAPVSAHAPDSVHSPAFLYAPVPVHAPGYAALHTLYRFGYGILVY
jgi:hypothetical protein